MLKVDWTKKKLIAMMQRDVKALNKQWSWKVIKSFTLEELWARTHPSYRDEYFQIAKSLKLYIWQ